MTPHPVLDAIGTAVAAGRSGDADGARRALLGLWDELGVLGDPVHRCALAHHLADLYPDAARALAWDVRALDAADAADPAAVAGFYPSLHLNLADDLRRLGSFDAAEEHLATAERLRGAGPAEGGYADLLSEAFRHVADALARRETAALPSHPGAAG